MRTRLSTAGALAVTAAPATAQRPRNAPATGGRQAASMQIPITTKTGKREIPVVVR
jgi:hypothetical protein